MPSQLHMSTTPNNQKGSALYYSVLHITPRCTTDMILPSALKKLVLRFLWYSCQPLEDQIRENQIKYLIADLSLHPSSILHYFVPPLCYYVL